MGVTILGQWYDCTVPKYSEYLVKQWQVRRVLLYIPHFGKFPVPKAVKDTSELIAGN